MSEYAKRDIRALDRAGNYYSKHVEAMTTEGLHDKSDIAAELGYRDMRIAELEKVLADFADVSEFDDALNASLADILHRTAVALRGPEPPLILWSWNDLPDRAAATIARIDELMLEHCPDEMTKEQLETWGANQKAVDE